MLPAAADTAVVSFSTRNPQIAEIHTLNFLIKDVKRLWLKKLILYFISINLHVLLYKYIFIEHTTDSLDFCCKSCTDDIYVSI